jgi:hypothetical protein
MKTLPARLLLTLSLVVLLTGVAARAQAQTEVKCAVPFDFSLGGQSFPSGDYSFRIVSGGASKMVLASPANATGGLLVAARVEDAGKPGETYVAFNRYGKRYLLSGLTLGGSAISLRIAPTRAEREMMASARVEVVTLTASR